MYKSCEKYKITMPFIRGVARRFKNMKRAKENVNNFDTIVKINAYQTFYSILNEES